LSAAFSTGEPSTLSCKELFFYGDFCSGRVWGLKREGESTSDAGLKAWQSEFLLQAESAIPMSKIGVDEEGNLFALGYLVGAIYGITEK
jgi:hypothetical protein